jgi:DNA-binding NarL/FixJ family response regulator
MAFHVLVVDDQREVSKAIRAGVQTLGPEFMVATAMSGEEAMLEARLQKFDLLISEVRLTGMSGVELLRKLRAIKPDIKVVLTTASIDRYIRREASDVGVDGLIEKPIEMGDLLSQIEGLLGKSGQPSTSAQALDEPIDEPSSISDRLSVMRQDLDASLALLISDTGEVLMQAGDIQQINLEAEISALLAVFSAGHKISRLLGMSIPDNLYTFRGSKHDLILTHVGDSHSLLIVTSTGSTTLDRIDKGNQVIRQGTQDLQAILSDMGVTLVTHEEPSLMESVEVSMEDGEEKASVVELDAALDALFSEGGEALKETDLDSFWEVASIEETGIFASSDALSYEQARQLGLAPEED